MKVNRYVNLSPDAILPAGIDIDNYWDGEWLVLRVDGEAEQTFLTLSSTPTGEAALPEGFVTVRGAMEGARSWFHVSPSDIDNVAEGGTIYLYLWTQPGGRRWLRGRGAMRRQNAARPDPLNAIASIPPGQTEPFNAITVSGEVLTVGGETVLAA